MEYLYGIDLGTTYSSIAECDEQLRISAVLNSDIATESGSPVVPSVVYFEEPDGKPIIGRVAKNQLGSPTTNRVVSLFKRSMGKNTLNDSILVGNQYKKLSPIEPSAYLLHSLITSNDARDRLAGNYSKKKKAVITIPTSFTSVQRMSTKIAAELAGIEVLGLLQEPTAAAISYNIKPGETMLVFDLGGGTLDVSIVNCKAIDGKDHYTVLATAGDYTVLDEYIGGIEWDKELKDYVLDNLADYQIGTFDDRLAEEWMLMCAAENCKKDLSKLQYAYFKLPNQTQCRVSQAEFRRRCDDLLKKCKTVVQAAVKKVDKNLKIDKCVMTGGSSQMPMIMQMLEETLSERIGKAYTYRKDWLLPVDPENAIAKGAAKYAYLLVHNQAEQIEFYTNDIHPYSYGIPVLKNRQLYIKNIILPTDSMVIECKDYHFEIDSPKEYKTEVWTYENTCEREGFWYEEREKYVLGGQPIDKNEFEYNSRKPKIGVTYRVSRDVNGIISIIILLDDQFVKKINIGPEITEEMKQDILKRMSLMDAKQ